MSDRDEDGIEYDWDDIKAEQNLKKHKVDFNSVEQFDWSNAIEKEDGREYNEVRMLAFAPIDGTIHCLIYTHRDPNIIRVISLRTAEPKERKSYVAALRQHHRR